LAPDIGFSNISASAFFVHEKLSVFRHPEIFDFVDRQKGLFEPTELWVKLLGSQPSALPCFANPAIPGLADRFK